MKIAIVTDSTAVMDKKLVEKSENLFTIPLQILFGDEVYRDNVDIDSEQFFNKLKVTENLPTTSQPSVGDVLELFQKLVKDFDQIIYITISSGISGTYSTGMLARNQMEDYDITIFDSLSTSVVQNRMVLDAVKQVNEGKTKEEVIELLEYQRDNSAIYLVVDDLKHLVRNGRLSSASGLIGGLLKIKPVLKFDNGKIEVFKKIRTLTKAHAETINVLDEQGITDASVIMVAQAEGIESAKKAQAILQEKYPNKDIIIGELSPVISVHTGPNTLGIAWIK